MVSNAGLRAMILAAGVGSRLDPLTKQLSKPMVPLMNRPVMEHMVGLLKKHGITDIVSNLHYLPEQAPRYFGDGSRLGVNMNYVVQDELNGDAGGVRSCREFLGDSTFVVVMGDLITDLDLSYVIQQHKLKGAIATIALKRVDDVSQFGVAVTDENGFITGFQEKPAPEEAISNLASTGVYILEPQIFDLMPAEGTCMFGRQVFPAVLANKLPLLGVETWGYWSDVGTPEQYRKTTFDAMNGMIDLDVPGEVTRFGWVCGGSDMSENLDVQGQLLVGYNTHIGEGVKIRGKVVIGDNCIIERGAEIHDSIVWSNNIIRPETKVRNCVIGMGCQIGRGTTLDGAVTIEPAHNLSVERLQKYSSDVRDRASKLAETVNGVQAILSQAAGQPELPAAGSSHGQ